jgi:hypothetical protein
MKMKRGIWMSFDLGVRGDYEGMYAWLDAHGAEECGDSVAYLSYEFEGDLAQHLAKDIQGAIEVTKKTRVYVVWQDVGTRSIKGRFVVGGRKAPPWAGSAGSTGEDESDGGSDEA